MPRNFKTWFDVSRFIRGEKVYSALQNRKKSCSSHFANAAEATAKNTPTKSNSITLLEQALIDVRKWERMREEDP